MISLRCRIWAFQQCLKYYCTLKIQQIAFCFSNWIKGTTALICRPREWQNRWMTAYVAKWIFSCDQSKNCLYESKDIVSNWGKLQLKCPGFVAVQEASDLMTSLELCVWKSLLCSSSPCNWKKLSAIERIALNILRSHASLWLDKTVEKEICGVFVN